MRDLAVLFLHLLATVARLAGPGGAHSALAELVEDRVMADRLPNQDVSILSPSGLESDSWWKQTL